MKTIYLWISICSLLLSTNTLSAQIKNAKIETFHVNGNCEMCKKTIENAGNRKKESQVTWNADSQSADISYDAKKTTADAVLKRIALAGYDNEKYLAPDETYAKLHGCCQYERTLKGKEIVPVRSHAGHETAEDHTANGMKDAHPKPIETIINAYMGVKDALINSDSQTAAAQATKLLTEIENLKMESLSDKAHQLWMNQVKEITSLTKSVAANKDIASQRQYFASLSSKIYLLAKVSPLNTPVYYQNCPMFNDGKGANWLSLNQEIQNPYYGSKMLTCGSVKEKID